MEPIAVSINTTVQMLGLGRTSVYSLLAEGRLQAFKIGRRTLITVESIRKLVAAQL